MSQPTLQPETEIDPTATVVRHEYRLTRKVEDEELPASVRKIMEFDDGQLSDGIFMKHQAEWAADESDLKLCEKGRRTGITWAEAHVDTLIAASARSEGGDNVYYIGDTKEKGLEFIGYCARFLRFIEEHAQEIWQSEEEVEYVNDDGTRIVERYAAYRIKTQAGHQIAALASRPAVIRGLQGIVVIDEAAFHLNVAAVIDACNALLIWGGKIRIISTHNGQLNAFNELIKETREGKWDYSLHRITFDDAVENGLYERRCLVNGETPTPEGKEEWYRKIRRSYGTRIAVMKQELDAIPMEGEGTLIPLVQIEDAATEQYKVARWEAPADNFIDWPEDVRQLAMRGWLADHVDPLLDALPKNFRHDFGEDFGMRVDRSSIVIGYTDQVLHRHVPFIVELRACPYDQQKQALFHIVSRLPRWGAGILDANGNGMVLAQEARQRFGKERITELMPNDGWLREHTPRFSAAFADRTIHIPADTDVRDDLRQFKVINGVGKIPTDVRTDGTDGGKRHADTAVAMLNFYAATLVDVATVDFVSTGQARASTGAFSGQHAAMGRSIDPDEGFGVVHSSMNLRGY